MCDAFLTRVVKRLNTKSWDAAGSPENALQNIVVHLDMLLTDEQKAAINWHAEQAVDLAVMRVVGWLLNKEPLRGRSVKE